MTIRTGPQPIRVLVAESRPHLLASLCRKLTKDKRFCVVAQAHTGDEAVASKVDFDVALVDLTISGLGSLGTVARLHQHHPDARIVVIADSDVVYLRNAATAEGASGYLVPADTADMGDRLVGLVGG
jgi:two-component system, NarL family, invasion response regulator UvrY